MDNLFLGGIQNRTTVSASINYRQKDWKVLYDKPFKVESLLGEGKDLTKQENLDNIERKKKRKVEKYHVYRFAYKERTFLVKMEKLTYGKEQFYSLMEE